MCTVGDDGVKGERWVFAVVLVLILVLNEMKMGGGGGGGVSFSEGRRPVFKGVGCHNRCYCIAGIYQLCVW